MKLRALTLSAFLFVACSGIQTANNSAPPDNNSKVEKNKQIALQNELTKITRSFQTLERQGRDMESYRLSARVEDQKLCNSLMTDRQQELKDLETKISQLPDNYNGSLSPLLADLNSCVSCAKSATESCVKSRAATNKLIAELYPK